MNIGEYFTKVFGKVFTGQVYWPTLVLMLIFGIIIGIVALIIGASVLMPIMGPVLTQSANTGSYTMDATALSAMLPSLLGLAVGALIAFIVFGLIIGYLMCVIQVFIIKKVQAIENKKSSGFFDGFGSSFLPGLKLFFAGIIYMIVVYVVLLVLMLIFGLIPFVGIVLNVLLVIALLLYVLPGMFRMHGLIATGSSFGDGLSAGFTTAFKMPRLIGYAFLLYLVLVIILFVGMLLSMIPFLGLIIMLFLMSGTAVYMGALAYYFAKEK